MILVIIMFAVFFLEVEQINLLPERSHLIGKFVSGIAERFTFHQCFYTREKTTKTFFQFARSKPSVFSGTFVICLSMA